MDLIMLTIIRFKRAVSPFFIFAKLRSFLAKITSAFDLRSLSFAREKSTSKLVLRSRFPAVELPLGERFSFDIYVKTGKTLLLEKVTKSECTFCIIIHVRNEFYTNNLMERMTTYERNDNFIFERKSK